MNLYIFNEKSRAAAYGIGTYINELSCCLVGTDINVNLVTLNADVNEFELNEKPDFREWLIPAEKFTGKKDNRHKTYSEGVVRLLKLYVKDTTNLIMHINFLQNQTLIECLRASFDCKIVSTVHYFNWNFDFMGNCTKMRHLLAKPENECDEDEIKQKRNIEKEIATLQASDFVISPSMYMHQIVQQDYKIDANKLLIIPNGLADASKVKEDARQNLRKQFYINNSEQIVIYAGRVDESKGVALLIEAFREVLKQKEDVRLFIVGEGAIEKTIKSAEDIWSKVSFTAFIDKNKLIDLYAISDVGVTPSYFEPFGYVAVEMMMCKLPVVATATSGLDEIVEDGGTGLKVEVVENEGSLTISPKQIAKHILFLLNNPQKAKEMGEKGRSKYLSDYNSELFKSRMVDFYNMTLKEVAK